MIYQSDAIYYHIEGENFNFYVYIFFELIDTFFLNLLLMIISINWFICLFFISFLQIKKKRLKIFRVISYEESQKRKLNLAIAVCRFIVFLVIASFIPIIILCSYLANEDDDYNASIFFAFFFIFFLKET